MPASAPRPDLRRALEECERDLAAERRRAATLTSQRDEARREVKATRLLEVRIAGVDVWLSPLERTGLTADPPAHPDGSLDEAAFLAEVDRHVWQRRLDQLTPDPVDRT